jgi:hypothetical protein
LSEGFAPGTVLIAPASDNLPVRFMVGGNLLANRLMNVPVELKFKVFMEPKLLLCLALVLSGGLVCSRCHADGINNVPSGNIRSADDIQTTIIKMPGLENGVIFTEQPTQFTVQMDVAGYRRAIPFRDFLGGRGKQFAADLAAEFEKHKPPK